MGACCVLLLRWSCDLNGSMPIEKPFSSYSLTCALLLFLQNTSQLQAELEGEQAEHNRQAQLALDAFARCQVKLA